MTERQKLIKKFKKTNPALFKNSSSVYWASIDMPGHFGHAVFVAFEYEDKTAYHSVRFNEKHEIVQLSDIPSCTIENMSTQEDEFLPDWASPPGDTIKDVLKERKISVISFAKSMNQNMEWMKKLLVGDIRINLDIARMLSKELGVTPEFWLNREKQYRESLKRINKKVQNDRRT